MASLNNDEHAWELVSRAYFFTDGMPTQTNITYQLGSEPLDLQLVATAKLEDSSLQEVVIYYQGTTLTSADTNIYDKLERMAADVKNEIKSTFSASVKKVFAPSASMDATSDLTATGTLTIV